MESIRKLVQEEVKRELNRKQLVEERNFMHDAFEYDYSGLPEEKKTHSFC